MERNMRRRKNERNLLRLLRYREISNEYVNVVQREYHFNNNLIKRLGLESELIGHEGCVNCLQWSSDGRHLASGSDDTNIIYWDPFHHEKLQVIPTPHTGNIFSVKFLDSNDSVIATAAGDCKVIVQSVPDAVSRSPPLLLCSCHLGRVKRLATCPDQPMIFWSAGEDGLVLQYDMRERHECKIQSKVFVDLSFTTELKCIQVNPTNSNYIAIGANDCFVRLYDRRKIKVSSETLKKSYTLFSFKRSSAELPGPGCVQYYAPAHLAKESFIPMSFKLAATYIAFNSAGTEMLVNMGGEQIYLFDVNNSKHINEIMLPQNLKTKQINTCGTWDSTLVDDESYIKKTEKLVGRKWMGDMYAAARNYYSVIQGCPEQSKPYIDLIKCLVNLNWSREAYEWMNFFLKKFPDEKTDDAIHTLTEKIKSMIVDKNEDEEMEKIDPQEKYLRQNSMDYDKRFLGHCNTTTDIKEVNFLGQDGNYLCAGSDEGVIFIWDKHTGDIVTALWGDVSIVNCVQPHPTACMIASSGIDPVVKLWSPSKEDGQVNPRVVKNLSTVVEDNQQRMSIDPFESIFLLGDNNVSFRLSRHQFPPEQIAMGEQKGATNLVTLLVGNHNLSTNGENKEFSYVGLAQSAGIAIESITQFYGKSKKSSKENR